jgi:hypothetical protein
LTSDPQAATAEQLQRLLLEPDRLRLRYAYAAALVHHAIDARRHPNRINVDQPGEPRDPYRELADAHDHLIETLRIAERTLTRLRTDIPDVLRAAIPEAEPKPKSNADTSTDATTGPQSASAALLPPVTLPENAHASVVSFLTETFIPTTVVLTAGTVLELVAADAARYFLARRDLAFDDPAAIVEQVAETKNYRVAYNLACFWSSYAEHRTRPPSSTGRQPLDVAFDHLRMSLTTAPLPPRRGLAQWAGEDPSLERLRTDDGYERRVADVLRWSRPDTPSKTEPKPVKLSDVHRIGERGAEALARVGIETIDDVRPDREFANEITDRLRDFTDHPNQARGWVNAALLLTLPEITVDIVNTLIDARYDSLQDIERVDRRVLWAYVSDQFASPPPEDVVKRWPIEARQMIRPLRPPFR